MNDKMNYDDREIREICIYSLKYVRIILYNLMPRRRKMAGDAGGDTALA